MKTKSIETLIKEQYIILIDSYEIENNIIAMTPDELERNNFYTLCEIHPSLITGLCVGLIPYSDHTQAPRITYHASMGKQAIGVYASTNNIRSDTIVHVLLYPERPLVQTHMGMVSGCNDMVFGMNLIVAVAMYTGFNQEDSVILNQSAIDRGMFRSFAFRTIHVEERKKSTTHTEDIMMPSMEIRAKSYNYTKLNTNGIVKAGIFVGPSDVIVGRVQTKNIKTGGEEKTDTSVCIKSGEEGYVDRVYISTSPEGYKMVKVKIRSLKVPEIGDKVASRAAQKGTVGMIFRQEDMPFCSQTGMVPDIIINPLCLPSRMTINQIIECIASKSSAQEGVFRFGTPFTRHSTDVVESLCNDLVNNGFSEDGKEAMTNGFTGDQFEARIFIGPTYYHRLKHLVSAKIHARNHGSLQALTRQPVEGRSRDGGLRFGEMERDCIEYSVPIPQKNGLSLKIGTMENNQSQVMGFSILQNGIVAGKQTGFLYKGERDCVELTFQDGRKLKCTPNHKLLNENNEWIDANHTKNRRLKVGINYPLIDVQQDINDCNGYILKAAQMEFKTNDQNNLFRTFAFVRLLGLLITDGGIYKRGKTSHCAYVSLGHLMDVEVFLNDLELITGEKRTFYKNDLCYSVRLPKSLCDSILKLEGFIVGAKVIQESILPSFALDPNIPLPILREFLGAMFGGDGHTCHLAMHRGKRDILTSLSFSKSRAKSQTKSLVNMMNDMQRLLGRFGISKVTIQNLKETSHSKKNYNDEENKEKVYQSTLHLDMNELIPFHEKIGFRYCYHKSQRLEAAVSYKRLRNEVTRQHNWIVDRVDKLTNFSEIKKADPTKIVGTKKAIIEAVKELQKIEPLIHEYAIPSTHDITDHLIKGTQFGKFTSKSFPNAEQYLKEVGAFEWFIDDDDADHNCYSVGRETMALPTMNLTVLDVRPCGKEKVFDIEVEEINSFLANGIVAHNCMISHGVSRFLTERLFDMSDVFSVPLCANCGAMPHASDICNVCDCTNIRRVLIPYACKLLFQELMAMGIKINLFPDEDKKYKTLPLN